MRGRQAETCFQILHNPGRLIGQGLFLEKCPQRLPDIRPQRMLAERTDCRFRRSRVPHALQNLRRILTVEPFCLARHRSKERLQAVVSYLPQTHLQPARFRQTSAPFAALPPLCLSPAYDSGPGEVRDFIGYLLDGFGCVWIDVAEFDDTVVAWTLLKS